ncbi:hypothetical protein SDJN02_04008, partial [Cucurbita argyrosperma subsp. argyrosperma]
MSILRLHQDGEIQSIQVPETVLSKHLIISKVQSFKHSIPTGTTRIHLIVIPTARLTPREVGDKRPSPTPFPTSCISQILLPKRTVLLAHLLCVPPPQLPSLSLHLRVPLESQKQVIANGVRARRRLRRREKKHPLAGSGGERRVQFQPVTALVVPFLDPLLYGVAEFGVIVKGNIRWVVGQRWMALRI